MLILTNARVLTLDPQVPTASALAIRDGRVLAAGTDEDALRALRSGSEPLVVIDLSGRVVWPGLIDAHLHLDYFSAGLKKIDCETASRAECLARVAERAAQTPPGEWVLGHGWNQNEWPEGFGSAALLDEAAPRNPVYLTAKSLHAGWANSLALQRAGLGMGSPDPQGGRLDRDLHGQLTGILFESAMEQVTAVLPEPGDTEVAEAIDEAQQALWRFGLTGVHDFDGRRCFSALQMLEQSGRLRLRVLKNIPHANLANAAELGLRSGFGSDLLRIGSVKLFADGALGPQTAAMLQPYEGSSGQTGMLLMDEEEIFEAGRAAAQGGLGLTIHAIGDLANHAVLNAYAQLRSFERQQALPHRRHRIEHVQLLHAADISRLNELGVIASMQPIHATSDMLTADQFWGQRASLSYAWQSVQAAGAAVAFGSDAPVESPNPFLGLHAAVTRRRADGSPGPAGWYPEQRLSLLDAVRGFTTGAAFAAGLEHCQGRLAPGYYADLIVLEQDPFELDPHELKDIQPVATMVAGDWVWQKGLA